MAEYARVPGIEGTINIIAGKVEGFKYQVNNGPERAGEARGVTVVGMLTTRFGEAKKMLSRDAEVAAAAEMGAAMAKFAGTELRAKVGDNLGATGSLAEKVERGLEIEDKIIEGARIDITKLGAGAAKLEAVNLQTIRDIVDWVVGGGVGAAPAAASTLPTELQSFVTYLGGLLAPGSTAKTAERSAASGTQHNPFTGMADFLVRMQLEVWEERLRTNGSILDPVTWEQFSPLGELGMGGREGTGGDGQMSQILRSLGVGGSQPDGLERYFTAGLTEADRQVLHTGTAQEIINWTKEQLLRSDIKPSQIAGWLQAIVSTRAVQLGQIDGMPAYERMTTLVEDASKIFGACAVIEEAYRNGGEARFGEAMRIAQANFGQIDGVDLLNRWWKDGARWMFKIIEDGKDYANATTIEGIATLRRGHAGSEARDNFDWILGERLMMLFGLRASLTKEVDLKNPEGNRLARMMNFVGYLSKRVLSAAELTPDFRDVLRFGRSKNWIKERRMDALNTGARLSDLKVRSLPATLWGSNGANFWFVNDGGAQMREADRLALARFGLKRKEDGEVIVDRRNLQKFLSVDFRQMPDAKTLVYDYVEICSIADAAVSPVISIVAAAGEAEPKGGELPGAVKTFVEKVNPGVLVSMSKTKIPPLRPGAWDVMNESVRRQKPWKWGYDPGDEVFDVEGSHREKFFWGLIGYIYDMCLKHQGGELYGRKVKGMWSYDQASQYVLLMTMAMKGPVGADKRSWAERVMRAKRIEPPKEVTIGAVAGAIGTLLAAEK